MFTTIPSSLCVLESKTNNGRITEIVRKNVQRCNTRETQRRIQEEDFQEGNGHGKEFPFGRGNNREPIEFRETPDGQFAG